MAPRGGRTCSAGNHPKLLAVYIALRHTFVGILRCNRLKQSISKSLIATAPIRQGIWACGAVVIQGHDDVNDTKETAPAKGNGKALPQTDGEAWAKVEAAAARAEMKQEAKTPAKTKIKSPKKAPTIAGEDVGTKALEAVNAEQKPPVAAKKEIAAEVKDAPKRARTVRVKAEPPVATIEQEVLTETQAAPPIAPEDAPAPAAEVETEPAPMVEIEYELAPEAEKEISIDAMAAVAHATPEQRPAQAARVEIEGEARIAVENAGDPVHRGDAQIEPEGAPPCSPRTLRPSPPKRLAIRKSRSKTAPPSSESCSPPSLWRAPFRSDPTMFRNLARSSSNI